MQQEVVLAMLAKEPSHGYHLRACSPWCCTLAVIAGLTAIPARTGARRSTAEILQAETA